MAFAGNPCQDWSVAGRVAKHGGDTMPLLHIFIQEANALNLDVIFCECTPLFDAEILRKGLPNFDMITLTLDARDDHGDVVLGDFAFMRSVGRTTMQEGNF